MNNFRYYTRLNDDRNPALILEAIIKHSGSQESTNVQMKIDTGTSISTVPERILHDLKAHKICDTKTTGYDGESKILPLYIINFEIDGNTFSSIKVIGIKNKNYGLIGRDILSKYFLRCDGPNERFELDFVT